MHAPSAVFSPIVSHTTSTFSVVLGKPYEFNICSLRCVLITSPDPPLSTNLNAVISEAHQVSPPYTSSNGAKNDTTFWSWRSSRMHLSVLFTCKIHATRVLFKKNVSRFHTVLRHRFPALYHELNIRKLPLLY
uniref:AlNc14C96G5860 protein n=1 Tax=Albugo laibachii Nc14 TaxID=890382 RepID=F0WGY4_9STRA|nr:AlNc14C96G5860 [Albugo laibachii Nc14]|eukprot:CCA20499.1 AlNc14C96G5860 [Albugo laibachii Nc14]